MIELYDKKLLGIGVILALVIVSILFVIKPRLPTEWGGETVLDVKVETIPSIKYEELPIYDVETVRSILSGGEFVSNVTIQTILIENDFSFSRWYTFPINTVCIYDEDTKTGTVFGTYIRDEQNKNIPWLKIKLRPHEKRSFYNNLEYTTDKTAEKYNFKDADWLLITCNLTEEEVTQATKIKILK